MGLFILSTSKFVGVGSIGVVLDCHNYSMIISGDPILLPPFYLGIYIEESSAL